MKSFIFTGDFEDYHDEFFIKKIYRKGKSEHRSHDDFVFMMNPDLNEKVPCFLMLIAPTIFKAGSSLHLLTRQELQQEL